MMRRSPRLSVSFLALFLPLFLMAVSCGGGGGGGDKANVDVLFFGGDDTAAGNWELWAYDGISTPSKVAEINSGANGSNPDMFTVLGNRVYFRATTDADGAELWATDGAVAWMVTDLNDSGSSNPRDLTVVGNSLFFRTLDPDALWRTDGTSAGTVEVAGPSHSLSFGGVEGLVPFGGGIVFTGSSASGKGLYFTNGTAAGTTVLDTGFVTVGDVSAFGGTILFAADDGSTGLELWSSDGSAGAATIVEELGAGAEGVNPRNMISLGDRIVFEASHADHGDELYESDGTAVGTGIVGDINGTSVSSLLFEELFLYEGAVYFTANETASDAETWTYDGTTLERLADINPGAEGSWGTYYQSWNGKLYISAYHPSYGNEMWVSDGSAMGTTLAFDLASGTGNGVLGD